MSKYADYQKKLAKKDMDWFFPEHKFVSNKYFEFKHYIDEDNVIIVTKNIITKLIKNQIMLIVDNNKAVYLKEFSIKPASNFEENIYGYVVKLNRKYFKPYTFSRDFEGFFFEKELTFDDFVAISKEQDQENMAIHTKGDLFDQRYKG